MKIIEIQFTPWTKSYWFDPKNHTLKVGDSVVVKTEIGIEIGEIKAHKDIEKSDAAQEIKPILRKANLSDLEKTQEKNSHKKEALDEFKQLIAKNKLDMKAVDVYYSFDGGRITFYFTAKGRIDFRDLVKDLTHRFQKSIRLHQIGVRDEAKGCGQIGPCGKCLCCKNFLGKLGQVSADFANCQQILHRGSERLTGVCGRLKCCLAFEQETYTQLTQKLPALGSHIKTEHGKGNVVALHVLKQTVDVSLDNDPQNIVEVKV